MAKTTIRPIQRVAASPGAGLLMTIFQRYVDQIPNRTRRELELARAIDAYPGGRETLENAVSSWRALPLDKRIAYVGRSYATLDPSTTIDDNALTKQVRTTFPVNSMVEVEPGVSIRRKTAAMMSIGAKPFTLSDQEIVGIPAQRGITVGFNPKIEVQAKTGPLHANDMVSDNIRKPGSVIGQFPVVKTMSGNVPLYQIEFAGVYCQKETSWDMWSPSDEMYACFSMLGDQANNWARRSAVYDKMDSGDDWREDPNPCILYGPAPAPVETFYINTLMCEYDYGNPDTITKIWHDAATVAACIAKYYGLEVSESVTEAAASLLDKIFGLGDDMMSSDTVMLHPSAFEYYANQPLKHLKVQLNYHFRTFHTDNDAKYHSFYRIRRV
jgi:hypothetical protein